MEGALDAVSASPVVVAVTVRSLIKVYQIPGPMMRGEGARSHMYEHVLI